MKASKIVKRSLLTISILLILIIGALFAIPFLFKDELLATIRQQANENLNAELDFSDASLSLFRSFPDLTVTLNDLKVTNLEPFTGITLLDVGAFSATVDIMSVIRGNQPIQVQSIGLVNPRIHVIVLPDGTTNYDITKPTPETTPQAEEEASGEIAIKLKRFSIQNGEVIYDDREGEMFAEILGLNHESRGDLTLDVYDLATQTTMESLSYEMDGIGYLDKAKIDLDAGFLIDMPNSKYTLKENDLLINALQLKADGWVAMPGEDIDMELAFQAPGSDFRELFSLIPNAYIEGYENVDIKGQFSLSGNVKGRYNDAQYPAMQIKASVDGGSVRYPDLPMGINQIAAKLNIDSPEGDLDGMFIDLAQFNMQIDDNPIEGYFKLRTPLSDPDIDTRIKGTLDLAELAQAFPMDETKGMAGKILADITAKTRLSTIESGAYDQVNMQGDMVATQIRYPMAGYPTVAIQQAKAQFTPNKVIVESFQAQLGKSDLQASGTIDNILAYFSPEKTMTGSLTMQSNYFNVDEWYGEEEEESATTVLPSGATAPAVEEEAPFDRFNFNVDGKIGKLDYDVYELTNMEMRGNLTPTRMTFSPLKFQMGPSDFNFSGVITNVWDYTFGEGVLGGNISMTSNFVDLNAFMESEEPAATTTTTATTASTAYEPIEVPGNMDLSIDAKINKVTYTDLVLDNFEGRLLIEDKAVIIERCTANGLDGKIAMSGSYDTKDPKKPAFTFKYDLQNLNFQKAFNTFNTFQAMAPIGKYIEGKFSSTMIMDSELGPDMMPVWSSVSADGFLQTINSVVKGFPPLQAVGQKLNVDYFDNMALSNTKNWFEVKDGALELKEFDYAYKGIDMKIGGRHSINQDMDYRIVAKIPRKMLEQSSVGAAAGSGLNALSAEASKLGINLAQSEFVNVQFNITGNITKPQVAMKLLGGDGQSSVAEGVKEQAKQEFEEQKEKAVTEAKEKVEEVKQQAKDTVKAVVKETTEQAKDKAKEVIDEQTKKTQEQIKKELEDFNPFKKKKGGGE